MPQQQNAHSNTRISAVHADRPIQWNHLKSTSTDISSRVNWVGKPEASISNVRAETAPKQGRDFPVSKLSKAKSFALQYLHVTWTEAELLCFIRVK